MTGAGGAGPQRSDPAAEALSDRAAVTGAGGAGPQRPDPAAAALSLTEQL